jgi:hypothetical protein
MVSLVQVSDKLPVSALPFTLRSSSLRPSSDELREAKMPEKPSLQASRWAPSPATGSNLVDKTEINIPARTDDFATRVISLPSGHRSHSNDPDPDLSKYPPGSTLSFNPGGRTLINTLTGEIVKPRIIPPRNFAIEEKFRQQNRDFMAAARGLLGHGNETKSNLAQSSPHPSAHTVTPTNVPCQTVHTENQKPGVSADFKPNTVVSGGTASQSKPPTPLQQESDVKSSIDIAVSAQHDAAQAALKNNESASLSKHVKSPMAPSDTEPMKPENGVSISRQTHAYGGIVVEETTVAELKSILSAIQNSMENQQKVARDIADKANAGRKAIHETGQQIQALHAQLAKSIETLTVALTAMSNMDEAIRATSTSFMNTAITPTLLKSLSNLLENKLGSSTTAQPLHATESQTKGSESNNKELQEQQANGQATIGQIKPPQAKRAISNGNTHEKQQTNGKHEATESSAELDGNECSLESIDVAKERNDQLEGKYFGPDV